MGKSKKELDAPFAASLVSAFVVNVGEGVVTPVVVGVGVGATGFQHRAVPARVQYCTGTGEYPDIRRSEISEDFFTVSGSTWTTHTSYLYLPDGKMATIRLTRIALEPTAYTPLQTRFREESPKA